MTRAPRPDGKIVEVANLPTRFEAEATIQLLAANGFQATGKFGDAGGWAPHFALVDGYRVLVFDEDLDAARALLEAEGVFEEAAFEEAAFEDAAFEDAGPAAD